MNSPERDEILPIVRGHLEAARRDLDAACREAGRDPATVRLLPVTKYAPQAAVEALIELGETELGESTVQGLLDRLETIGPRAREVRWHLIGHLQRNKAGRALESCQVFHALDSLRLAEALDRRLDRAPGPFSAYLEVNLTSDPGRHGFSPEETLEALEKIHEKTRLGPVLVGLMGIAPKTDDFETARVHFARLRQLRDRALEAGLLPAAAGLSMGMSLDFRAAIAEGATIVRLGTRLFEGLPRRE